MGLFNNWLQKHKEAKAKNENDCNRLILQLDYAIDQIDALFYNRQNYIDPQIVDVMQGRWRYLFDVINPIKTKHLKKAVSYRNLLSETQVFNLCFSNIDTNVSIHNSQVIQARVNSAYSLIGDVEGKKLDLQQMQCIVKSPYNHLVIAGAGTGKTTTIIGRIKYLLKSEMCSPNEILVLSFTNASAKEMKERISKETGENIDACTFHKLGLNIITNTNGVTPKISKIELRKLIKEKLNSFMLDEKYLHLLTTYLLYNRVVSKSEFEFSNMREYNEYLSINPPTTLNNEVVKSYGEMDIANFLTSNGINYNYEKSYEFDTRTEEFTQYYPDFYLPDYNIYIEYFGVNQDGNVPDYFTGKNGKTARQLYKESMDWKRKLHKDNGTILVECFAYEKKQGNLLLLLENHLRNLNVQFSPIPTSLLWKNLLAKEGSIVDGIIELFETVINLVKSNRYSFDLLKSINIQKGQNILANEQLITLVEPIYHEYDKLLKQDDEIDFNDMINLATQYVNEKKYNHSYKYVIVDEYQDISKSRYSLLHEMRINHDYILFCVGDDWQSIYRFAGSDIGFILNFSKYWGPTETSRIETTYRFSQKLIDVSGSFIMQNPKQIRKAIRGNAFSRCQAIAEINAYNEKYAVDFLTVKLQDFSHGSTVYFIGRYGFDVKILQDNSDWGFRYNNTIGMTEVHYPKRPDLKMFFLTAHKSKGLQADYVVIINNKKGRMGFPSKIQDAPILNLLLDDCDDYPNSEERRLFYVALTRAKIKAILLTVKNNESEFAQEIKRNFSREIKLEAFECPACGGKLAKKTGPYGEFWGCSNYRTSNCRYIRTVNSKC